MDVSICKRTKCFPSTWRWRNLTTQQSPICVFKKILDRKITWLSLGHTKAESRRFLWRISSVDVTVRFTVEMKLRFQISPAKWRRCLILVSKVFSILRKCLYYSSAIRMLCAFSIKLRKQEGLNRPQAEFLNYIRPISGLAASHVLENLKKLKKKIKKKN